MLSFHFEQQAGGAAAVRMNKSIYGSTVRDVCADLLIVTPMMLLFTQSLMPAFVSKVLAKVRFERRHAPQLRRSWRHNDQ